MKGLIIITFFLLLICLGSCVTTERFENKLHYGGVDVDYITDPGDPNFYYIDTVESNLKIQDPNKYVGFVAYEPILDDVTELVETDQEKVKPRTGMSYHIDRTMSVPFNDLNDSGSYANELILRSDTSEYDQNLNRFATTKEDYF